MIPEELAAAIRIVLGEVSAEGPPILPTTEVPDPHVGRLRDRNHGDWFTNVAMQLAKKVGTRPHDLAELPIPRLEALDGIASVGVAGPNFLNICLGAANTGGFTRSAVGADKAYGHNDPLSGQHINLECISANPTGPIHLGGARWAAIGDSLARILFACGTQVTRECYLSDHGARTNRFVRSLLVSAYGQETPEDDYGGAYVSETAQWMTVDKLVAGHPGPAIPPDAEATKVFRSHGVDPMLAAIKTELHAFRSDFDVFFHENSLHTSGTAERAVIRLCERSVIGERDGTTWLRTTDFGDDKDRVLIKSDGNTVYFATDLVYYLDRRGRGADCAIYLLGADHHDCIGRMTTMCVAFGGTPDTNMQILINQLINLVCSGIPMRISKCVGTIVTLEDLVGAVGVDATRYTLARPSMGSMIDIDLNLLTSSTSNNPVYYIQYAHAHTHNVARNTAGHGVGRDPNETPFEPGALGDPADTALLGVLAQFLATMTQAAQLREQYCVARYFEQLAAAYYAWYDATHITPREDNAVDSGHAARLWLNDTIGQVLVNGLDLLGVSAPERMRESMTGQIPAREPPLGSLACPESRSHPDL